MSAFRIALAASCLLVTSTVSRAQQTEPATGTFQKQTTFGVWSKNIFADAVTVTGPAKTIYLAGMGAEDVNTGAFLYQCRYAYAKIKKILAAQGATMADVVKITTYVTDMRYSQDYVKCFAEAMSGAALPAHTLVNI